MPSNLRDDGVHFEDAKPGHLADADPRLKKGDLILGVGLAELKVGMLWDEPPGEFSVAGGAVAIRFKPEYDPMVLYLRCMANPRTMLDKLVTGSVIMSIRMDYLKSLEMPEGILSKGDTVRQTFANIDRITELRKRQLVLFAEIRRSIAWNQLKKSMPDFFTEGVA